MISILQPQAIPDQWRGPKAARGGLEAAAMPVNERRLNCELALWKTLLLWTLVPLNGHCVRAKALRCQQTSSFCEPSWCNIESVLHAIVILLDSYDKCYLQLCQSFIHPSHPHVACLVLSQTAYPYSSPCSCLARIAGRCESLNRPETVTGLQTCRL